MTDLETTTRTAPVKLILDQQLTPDSGDPRQWPLSEMLQLDDGESVESVRVVRDVTNSLADELMAVKLRPDDVLAYRDAVLAVNRRFAPDRPEVMTLSPQARVAEARLLLEAVGLIAGNGDGQDEVMDGLLTTLTHSFAADRPRWFSPEVRALIEYVIDGDDYDSELEGPRELVRDDELVESLMTSNGQHRFGQLDESEQLALIEALQTPTAEATLAVHRPSARQPIRDVLDAAIRDVDQLRASVSAAESTAPRPGA